MSNDDWLFMDDDFIDNNRQKSISGNAYQTWLKENTPVAYWFLTNPTTNPANDWINYRELPTRDGLMIGAELPSSLSNGVPVRDYEFLENEKTGRREYRYDNDLDPLTAGKPGRQMWVRTKKNSDENTGLVTARWRTMVNVVDAVSGYHNLLVLSVPARKSLKEFFRSATRTNKNFDITERPFKLLYTGKGFQWTCAVDVIDSEDTFELEGKDYVFPDSPELPEPIDVKAYLLDKRAEMDDFISSLRTGSGQAADTSGLDMFGQETRPMPDWAAPFDKEEAAPQAKPQGEHKEIDIERYMEMAPARMRSLAAKAGLNATKGMTKVELAKLLAEGLDA